MIYGADYNMDSRGPYCEHLLILSNQDRYCLRCGKRVND